MKKEEKLTKDFLKAKQMVKNGIIGKNVVFENSGRIIALPSFNAKMIINTMLQFADERIVEEFERILRMKWNFRKNALTSSEILVKMDSEIQRVIGSFRGLAAAREASQGPVYDGQTMIVTHASGTSFPRRGRVGLTTRAESVIDDAMAEVERLPESKHLTEALEMLTEARNKVSNYVDGELLRQAKQSSDD